MLCNGLQGRCSRTVAGYQSLVSVYLIALWVLTYFRHPFEWFIGYYNREASQRQGLAKLKQYMFSAPVHEAGGSPLETQRTRLTSLPSSVYQKTWFDTARIPKVRPRVFYDWQASSK